MEDAVLKNGGGGREGGPVCFPIGCRRLQVVTSHHGIGRAQEHRHQRRSCNRRADTKVRDWLARQELLDAQGPRRHLGQGQSVMPNLGEALRRRSNSSAVGGPTTSSGWSSWPPSSIDLSNRARGPIKMSARLSAHVHKFVRKWRAAGRCSCLPSGAAADRRSPHSARLRRLRKSCRPWRGHGSTPVCFRRFCSRRGRAPAVCSPDSGRFMTMPARTKLLAADIAHCHLPSHIVRNDARRLAEPPARDESSGRFAALARHFLDRPRFLNQRSSRQPITSFACKCIL